MGHVTQILSPYSTLIHQHHIFSKMSKNSQMDQNRAKLESNNRYVLIYSQTWPNPNSEELNHQLSKVRPGLGRWISLYISMVVVV